MSYLPESISMHPVPSNEGDEKVNSTGNSRDSKPESSIFDKRIGEMGDVNWEDVPN